MKRSSLRGGTTKQSIMLVILATKIASPKILSCGHIFFKNVLGSTLADLNKPQSLPKDAVNPKWQNDQKNSCRIGQMAIPNLKRSGFVKIPLNFSLSRNEQNKVPLFF